MGNIIGQLVVIKEFDGCGAVCRVHSTTNQKVFVNDEEQWNKRLRGELCLEPVAVPKEDVFKYERRVEAELGAVNWERLQPIALR